MQARLEEVKLEGLYAGLRAIDAREVAYDPTARCRRKKP